MPGSLSLIGVGPTAPASGPEAVPSLAAWFKADAITGKNDGDAISQWNDSSTNTRHVAQATGANQPLYKTGIINGLPAVRFDGVNDRLSSSSFLLAQPWTCFVVGVCRGLTTGRVFVDGLGASNRGALYLAATTHAASLFAGTVLTGPVVTHLSPHVYSGLFNGASSAVRVDGGTATVGNANTNSPSLLNLGTAYDGTLPADIDMAECIVYSANLSTADRQRVERYLGSKYGITVP